MKPTHLEGHRPAEPSGARHAQGPPRRRRARTVAAVALLLVLLLITAVLAVRALWEQRDPVPEEEPETVSCAPYGLDLRVPVRQREDEPHDNADSLGPGDDAGDRFDLSFTDGGVTSRYHVLAEGVDWDRPVGVVFRLHGDGAFEFERPEYNVSCLAEVARSHNMILVVPRTPDRTGEVTWWEQGASNGRWFRALVEERLLADYDVDRSRTWLTGYSGGAQLISQVLLADHVDLVPGGGAIMLGGGGAPRVATSEPTGSQLRELRLHWDVGRDDDGSDPDAPFDALSAARSGHGWYEEQGFEWATLRVRKWVDHFEIPDARILERVLAEAEEEMQAGPGAQTGE